MRTLLLFIGLIGFASAQTTMRSGGATEVVTGSTMVNDDRALLFYFDPAVGKVPVFQNRTANGSPALQQESNQPYEHSGGVAEIIEPDPNDGNLVKLHILSGYGFPSYSWFSNRNDGAWGDSLGKGRWVVERWSHGGTLSTNKLIMQLNGKSVAGSPLDFNEGLAVRTQLIGGSNEPGLQLSPDHLKFIETAAYTPKRIERRWNRMMSNPNNVITDTLYVTELTGANAGFVRSAWAKSVYSALPGGPAWHQWQTPDDISSSLEHWFGVAWSRRSWTYDLPVNLRLTMETLTGGITTGNLEANPGMALAPRTGRVVGSMSGFSVTTNAEMAMPSTVNLSADGGTYGVRRDLSVTTGGCFGVARSAGITTQQTVTYLYRAADLATNTSVITFFAGPSTPANFNEQYMCVQQADVAGQEKLRLFRTSDSTAGTGDFNVTPGTVYAVSFSFTRNSTCYLEVRLASTGQNLGSAATHTAPNNSMQTWFVGSYSNITAQASGVYYDVDDVCIDTNGTPLWPICFWENPNL